MDLHLSLDQEPRKKKLRPHYIEEQVTSGMDSSIQFKSSMAGETNYNM